MNAPEDQRGGPDVVSLHDHALPFRLIVLAEPVLASLPFVALVRRHCLLTMTAAVAPWLAVCGRHCRCTYRYRVNFDLRLRLAEGGRRQGFFASITRHFGQCSHEAIVRPAGRAAQGPAPSTSW
jgi:hypothetical protein